MVERFQIQELIFLDREGNRKAQFFSERHIQAIAWGEILSFGFFSLKER